MTSLDSFPGPSGITDAIEAGKDLAGLVVKSSAGVPRAGVFPRSTASLIAGRADLKVDIGIFESVLLRSGSVRFSGNDASATVPAAPLTAPVSNTKYAVFYQKQNEVAVFGDANNLSVIDAVQGAAFASLPTALADARALLPAGAIVLGHVALTPGATATNALTITPTYLYTALTGGRVWVRNSTELAAWTPADDALAVQLDTLVTYKRVAGAWKAWESDWITYTPTITGFVIGTGGLAASVFSYRYEAGMVRVRGKLTIGTSGASVASNPTFSLPVPAVTLNHPFQAYAGLASMWDASAVVPIGGFAAADDNSVTTFRCYSIATTYAAGAITASAPFVWNATDTLQFEFTYRPA